jgi:hypothetical protein
MKIRKIAEVLKALAGVTIGVTIIVILVYNSGVFSNDIRDGIYENSENRGLRRIGIKGNEITWGGVKETYELLADGTIRISNQEDRAIWTATYIGGVIILNDIEYERISGWIF